MGDQVPEFLLWKTFGQAGEALNRVDTAGCNGLQQASALNREGGPLINICDNLASRIADGLPFTPGAFPIGSGLKNTPPSKGATP